MVVRMISACLLGSALTVAVGCSTVSDSALVPLPGENRSLLDDEELRGSWVVYAIGQRPVGGPHSPRVEFAIDDRFGGMAGCNHFLTDYHLDSDGVLRLGDMKVTRRICAEPIMFQERLLLSRLRGVESGRLTPSGDLLLFYDEDRLPIRLQREDRVRLSDQHNRVPPHEGRAPG